MSIQDCEHLDVHGGSLRVTIRKSAAVELTARAARTLVTEASRLLRSECAYAPFVNEVSQERAEVAELLHQVTASGRSLAGYGAAAKATVLSRNSPESTAGRSTTSSTGILPKQGRFIPGTAIPVMPVEHLRENARRARSSGVESRRRGALADCIGTPTPAAS